MNKEDIKNAFERLNAICKEQKTKGEIGVVGGAAMVLAYGSDRSTKDVDAIFKPSTLIRKAVAQVSEELGLKPDWLNDAVKGYFSKKKISHVDVFELSNLLIWVPEPEYMLAMKSMSARFDSKDSDDLISLCKILGLKSTDEVFDIIDKYYPKKSIPAKTVFFIEEIFERGLSNTKFDGRLRQFLVIMLSNLLMFSATPNQNNHCPFYLSHLGQDDLSLYP